MSLRTVAKRVLEMSMRASGAAALRRRAHRHDTLVLAYHNIVPAGERAAGDLSLHLPQRAFADQLDQLQETHDVVSMQTLLAELQHDSDHADRSRPRAVITFDDAYLGAVTAGVDELRARNLPATLFVTPHFLDGGTFWWDRLSVPGGDGIDPAVREQALTEHAGRGEDILAWAQRTGLRDHPLPVHATCASQDDLRAALSHRPLSLGAHTWSHVNLARVHGEELTHELRAPREWLHAFVRETASAPASQLLDAITYPYGLATPQVWAQAEAVGYAAGMMIDGGWIALQNHTGGPAVPPDKTPTARTRDMQSRYALPRLNVPAGVSTSGFVLRTAGLVSH